MGTGDEFLKLHGVTTRSFSIGSRARAADCAVLDLVSTSRGLLFPRMTSAQRAAIVSPVEGLVVFDTTAKSLYIYAFSTWLPLDSGAGTFFPADTVDVLTGFAAYIASDGKAYETDARYEDKAHFAGVDVGLPDVLQAAGAVTVRFSSKSPKPIPGQVAYLARGDDEMSEQSRGKLTTTVPFLPSQRYPIGIVLSVPVNYDDVRAAQVLVQPCACRGGSGSASDEVTGIRLLGEMDGTNATFTTPHKFVHVVGGVSIKVYLNGQRLLRPDDYEVYESGGAYTGYDTVILQRTKLPKQIDRLWADYLLG